MKHVEYKTQGTCSQRIIFDIDDDNKIHNTVFIGGCNGNLKAISKLVEGMEKDKVIEINSKEKIDVIWTTERKYLYILIICLDSKV